MSTDGKYYLAVYDALRAPSGDEIGLSFSTDGVTWKYSALLRVQPDQGSHPCGHIRTPLGLAPEPERCEGCYSVLWTGITNEKGPSGSFRPVCHAIIRDVNEKSRLSRRY